jgi:hypothetical protein
MAQDKGQDNSSLIEALGEVVGSQIAKANAKKEPIAAVYTSGMRGDEKPPQLRNGDEGVKQAKEKGLGKGIDPKKAAASSGPSQDFLRGWSVEEGTVEAAEGVAGRER